MHPFFTTKCHKINIAWFTTTWILDTVAT